MKKLFFVILIFAFNSAYASNFVGQLAPSFKLMAQDGSHKSLNDYRGKWLVLYFYPKDDTPGCTTEAKNFRDAYAKFQSLETEIVGVSLDDNASHQDFSKKYQLPFDIFIGDTEKKSSQSL